MLPSRSDSQQRSLENPDKQTMRVDSTKRTDKLIEVPRKKLNMRLYTDSEQKFQDYVNSKIVTISIIALVGAYAVLIFIIVALEELLDVTQFNKVSSILSWIELGILIVFILEIIVGLYAWGIKKYYKDKWLILDTLIILLSLFFVIFELADQKTSNVIKVIQAVFRFLRIFLLIRKAQTFRRLATISTISTPAEKIVRFLAELKEVLEVENMKLDIDYCIDKIGNNQLYQMGKLDEDNAEAMAWLNQSQQGRAEVKRIVTNEQQQQQKKVIANFQKLNIPKRLLEILYKQHDDLYIDPFECDKLSGGEGLVNLMLFFFENYNLFDVFLIKPKVVRGYFEEVMKGYLDNPYHNKVHAQDVAQTCNFLLSKCKFIEIGQLDEQDIACVLIAGAIHDYGHPGLTNAFLINSRNELALTYNDQSVLEMYHPSQCFKIAWGNQKVNIFENLQFHKYRRIRESIILMVLSTDMAHHASELALTNSRIAAPDFEPNGKDKQRLMDLIVHSSDVSNPTKSFEIYKQWTEKVLTEFWLQGDKERDLGLPISYLCNRYTTNTAEAQVGFIDYVVKPTFACILGFLPAYEPFFQNLDKNKAKWQELIDQLPFNLNEIMINYNQIYVAVRIKAYLNSQDKEESCISSFTDKQIVISKSNLYEQQYEYNQIFDPQCDQEQIYLCVVNPIVTDALNGISSNLIIYGSQGSGKTYSLFGTIGSLFTLKQGLISIESGIAIRMIHQLHSQKQISELKIYIIDNEQIVNHLSTNGQSKWIELAKQLCEVIQNLNDSIIHVVIELKTLQNSKIKIIQIGSISKGNSGQMVTHNKSIFTLHRCIQCLIDQQKQKKLIQMQRIYIPFRESKLTNLLSNSFLGQAQLKIILCLAPTKIDDAFGTLQFGQQFQQIKIVRQQSKHQTQFSVQQQFQTQSQLQINEFNSMTTQSQTLEMIPIQFHLQKIQELTDKYESIIHYLQQKIIKYKNR